MRITGIETDLTGRTAIDGESSGEFTLMYLRNSVIMRTSGGEVLVKAPAAIIFAPDKKQYLRTADGRPMRGDILRFRLSNADRQYIASMLLPINEPVTVTDEQTFVSTIRSIVRHFGIKNRFTGEFMELSLRILFICLCAPKLPQNDASSVPRLKQLRQLRQAIYDDPSADWNIDQICRDMCISRAYFHRIYQEAFGVTCRSDVIESRLSYAETLLSTTDKTVMAISEMCGYESDVYFMRQFRQRRGCTPTEYRRRVSNDQDR
jgi:AraC-like DNA-binding protein